MKIQLTSTTRANTLRYALAMAVFAVALAATLPALNVKAGDVAPPITLLKTWNMKQGRSSLADFRGEFVLYFMFGTDSEHCQQEIPKLIQQEERYGEKGFRILATTGQSNDIIEEFLKKEKWLSVNYTVGRISAEEEKAYGPTGFPTVLLIGPDGKIVSAAARDLINNQTEIEKHLKSLKGEFIDPAIVKGAKKAVASFNTKEYGKAYEIATKLNGDAEAKQVEKDGAKVVLDRISEIEASLTRRIDNIVAYKDYAHLEAVVLAAGKSWKGHSLESKLKTHREFLKSKEGARELKAIKDFAKLEQRYRKAADAKVRAVVVTEITTFITANEGTAAADKAKALIGK